MANAETTSIVSASPSLLRYYHSFESRVGYRIFLGGARHYGYYPAGTFWPFPISRALRAMEDQLFNSLDLVDGATVLDAGCGMGRVAIHMARRGLRVVGIDVVDHHLVEANRNIKATGLEEQVSARKMNYHSLDGIQDESMDGVYTMETFVHANDPEKALSEFYRVLKPGGSLALHEYDHVKRGTAPGDLEAAMDKINTFASMPANAMFDQGFLPRMLEDVGFENVKVRDLTLNVVPMLRFFFVVAYIPFLIIRLFGLESRFINTVAGVAGYRGRKVWRYTSVAGTKPGSEVKKRGSGNSGAAGDEGAR
ncbi:hypothetical protein FGG08_004669 [Glutinoglossum americanum]|uniref:Methyltransferase type 11 domain-containing protein n=1 Tax=Glutinoglossum americanum TaxID=1670608 RepID=A0A9P8I042_9PEZI|nr:hypothetical protein FGG08_004669 [Glutinoglossum americanum]